VPDLDLRRTARPTDLDRAPGELEEVDQVVRQLLEDEIGGLAGRQRVRERNPEPGLACAELRAPGRS
jgi:hypothetical protein